MPAAGGRRAATGGRRATAEGRRAAASWSELATAAAFGVFLRFDITNFNVFLIFTHRFTFLSSC